MDARHEGAERMTGAMPWRGLGVCSTPGKTVICHFRSSFHLSDLFLEVISQAS
jgi:hypothetical protein